MRFQDINASDKFLRDKFIELWLSSKYAEAFQLIKDNQQLDKKVFVNEVMNYVGRVVLAIENRFHQDFVDSLSVKLEKYDRTINNFYKKGDWNSSEFYLTGNFVNYQKDVYMCLMNNINVLPSDSSLWVRLKLEGEKGADGIDAHLKYEWTPNAQYKEKDVVLFGEYLWYCNIPNKNNPPQDLSEYWSKFYFLTIPKAKVIISETKPITIDDGTLWLRIIK